MTYDCCRKKIHMTYDCCSVYVEKEIPVYKGLHTLLKSLVMLLSSASLALISISGKSIPKDLTMAPGPTLVYLVVSTMV